MHCLETDLNAREGDGDVHECRQQNCLHRAAIENVLNDGCTAHTNRHSFDIHIGNGYLHQITFCQ